MPETVITSKRCMFCGKTHLITLDRAAYEAWMGGTHIQNAFPTMSADEREVLISGTCPGCWDEHMGSDDDDFGPTDIQIYGAGC